MSYNPKFTIYHSDAKCRGCKLSMLLVPLRNIDGDDIPGYVEMSIAPQISVGVPPTFSDDNSVTVRLRFEDVCKMLQVFRGERECIEGGLAFTDSKSTLHIKLVHQVDPNPCYIIDMVLVEKINDNVNACTNNSFTLTNAEALGVCEALTTSCGMLVFGVQSVITYN